MRGDRGFRNAKKSIEKERTGAEAEAAMQMLSKLGVRKKLGAFTENRWRCLSCIFEAKKSPTCTRQYSIQVLI